MDNRGQPLVSLPTEQAKKSLEKWLKPGEPGEAMSLYDVAFTAVKHSELGKNYGMQPMMSMSPFLIISLHARSCQYHGFW